MFEHASERLLSRRKFAIRMAGFFAAAVFVDFLAVAIGATGFRVLERVAWLDAIVNAALVITGNGPIVHPTTTGGKWFLVIDAMIGATVYVLVVAVLLTPIVHRIMHSLHAKPPDENLP